jgi:endo-1,4-beta-D-glucanase Y
MFQIFEKKSKTKQSEFFKKEKRKKEKGKCACGGVDSYRVVMNVARDEFDFTDFTNVKGTAIPLIHLMHTFIHKEKEE